MDLLRRTIDSFKVFADSQPSQIIVSENSCKTELKPVLTDIFKQFAVSAQITVHEQNRGQVWAIDHAYSQVDEDLIFHLEDDWAFFDTGFIEKSAAILNEIPEILQTNVRRRMDGSKGAQHPVSDEICKTPVTGVEYREYLPGYLGTYHGFSFNPSLRRLKDYYLGAPYKNIGGEEPLGEFYKKQGFRFACINNRGYCWHTGEGTTLPGANS